MTKKKFTKYEKLTMNGTVTSEHKIENVFGERFSVLETPIGVYLAGDETDWDVIPLFGDFMVTDEAELRGVGEALIAIADAKRELSFEKARNIIDQAWSDANPDEKDDA